MLKPPSIIWMILIILFFIGNLTLCGRRRAKPIPERHMIGGRKKTYKNSRMRCTQMISPTPSHIHIHLLYPTHPTRHTYLYLYRYIEPKFWGCGRIKSPFFFARRAGGVQSTLLMCGSKLRLVLFQRDVGITYGKNSRGNFT